MMLTPEDRAEWATYEAANTAARRDYNRHPSRKPAIRGHVPCTCCETQTVQPSGRCLGCQEYIASVRAGRLAA